MTSKDHLWHETAECNESIVRVNRTFTGASNTVELT